MIGLGMTLGIDEFNRRALIALNGVRFGEQNRAEDIAEGCRTRLEAHKSLSDKQQQALFNIVHRFRGQISDQAVKDLAATKAKGSD